MQGPPPQPGREASNAYWASIQDENGVDLTLIRANLRLSPSERLRRGDQARESALRLQAIGKVTRERKQKPA
jgi:hypothetical protein